MPATIAINRINTQGAKIPATKPSAATVTSTSNLITHQNRANTTIAKRAMPKPLKKFFNIRHTFQSKESLILTIYYI